MSRIEIDALIDKGLQAQAADQLTEAESAYVRALELDPNDPDALHLLGVVHHQTGRRQSAIDLLTRAATLDPAAALFHFNLAEALRTAGNHDRAAEHYRTAVSLEPTLVDAYLPLAEMLIAAGRPDEAIQPLKQAQPVITRSDHGLRFLRAASAAELHDAVIAVANRLVPIPSDPESLTLWGKACAQTKDYKGAIAHYQRAAHLAPSIATDIELASAYADDRQYHMAVAIASEALRRDPCAYGLHFVLGHCMHQLDLTEDAIEHYRLVLTAEPAHVPSRTNLATILRDTGRWEEAIRELKAGLERTPESPELLSALSLSYKIQGDSTQAIEFARKALRVKPDDAPTLNLLAVCLSKDNQSPEGIELLHRCIQQHPKNRDAYGNLGTVYLDRGQVPEAIGAFHAGLEVDPNVANIRSNLLLAATYDDTLTPQQVFELHREYNQFFGGPDAVNRKAPLPRAGRRLRIGYVSPDFRQHVAAFFIGPALMHANPDAFQIFCYANVQRPDQISGVFKSLAHHWRDIVGLSDERVRQMIEDDQIDILVDLAGHTAENRLPVFGSRAAPVQVTMIGYPNTTGLQSMDYQITDRYLHPPGEMEGLASESLFHLPEVFACYRPPNKVPDVGPLPALKSGEIVFGSFSNLAKLRPPVLQLWSRIAARVPNSRFVIQGAGLSDSASCELFRERCIQAGLPMERVTLAPTVPFNRFFESLNSIDVALDSFPFNGHTTSCQLLHMGVPLITLAGRTRSGRMGVTLLSNLNLHQLIAHSEEEYVDIAARLASDLPYLASLRSTLRHRLETSPIMDGRRWVRHLEAAYETMWQKYADAQSGISAIESESARSSASTVVRKHSYPSPDGKLTFSIIVCSRTPERVQRTLERCRAIFGARGLEFVEVFNPSSLSSGYNLGLRECTAEHVLLSHDDVEILTSDASEKIEHQLSMFDVLGVVGTDKLMEASWIWAGQPHIFGQIGHPRADGSGFIHFLFGRIPAEMPRIQAIDGLFMAARRSVFDRVRFDEETFTGFHLYDIDFSYAAHLAGFRVGILRGVHFIHESGGRYDLNWEEYRKQFLEKYPGRFAGDFSKKPEMKQHFAFSKQRLMEMMRQVDA